EPLAGHDHRRAPADAVIEIEHVRVVHANAAIRDEAADRSRVVGAVNGVFPASAERQGGRTHGIARASAWNYIRQRGLVALDFLGRATRIRVGKSNDFARVRQLRNGRAASRSAAERAASERGRCMKPPIEPPFPADPGKRLSSHWSRWEWKGSTARQLLALSLTIGLLDALRFGCHRLRPAHDPGFISRDLISAAPLHFVSEP